MRPILILCCGMFAISINDLLFKFFSGDYSLHQLVFMRTVGALLILLPLFVSRAGFGVFKTDRILIHMTRSALLVAANLIFFSSLVSLPLAETTSIVYLSPLLLTIFAFIFLKEQVGPIRWACIALGFFGTLLVIQPFSVSFKPVMLLPLCSAFFYASFTTLTRHISKTEPTERLAFYSLLGFFITSGLVGLFLHEGISGFEDNQIFSFIFRPWQIPGSADWPYICLIGISSAIIALCLSAAYRMGEASMLAPFEYSALPFSLLWGFMFFGDWPNSISLLGMTLIVSAGMFLAYREISKQGRLPRLSPRSMTAQGTHRGQNKDQDA